jgi:HlyD family secretion protein
MTAPVLLPNPVPNLGWDVGAVAPNPLRRIVMLSVLTIVLGFGGMLGWAATSQLQIAVPAPGVIVAAGRRKTVSLMDGGILQQLLVAEGDKVAAGQVLLRLDDVQASATVDEAAAQYWGAMAQATRLQAEALDSRTLTFPPELQDAAGADPAIAAELEAERHSFEARWATFDSTAQIGHRRIEQQRATEFALQGQIREVGLRLQLFAQDQNATRDMLAKGLATRVHANELERAAAELRGQLSDLAGRLAETRQLIAQTELEILNAAQSRRADITKDRSTVQAQMADAAGRLRAARDILARRVVTAPEAGVVTDLKFFTPGSSIGAGQPVLDLVPADSSLLVEAMVAPTDIEHVRVGQAVNIRLTAYKAHQVPVVTGHLVYVSADRLLDAQNQPVFKVRAALDASALNGLHGVALYAGMPADVLIIEGARSALDYLISPIKDSIRHAMHED